MLHLQINLLYLQPSCDSDMVINRYKSDYLGALTSFLCLIHCVVTPIFYVINVKSFCCQSSAPTWWRSLDYIFLVISFFTIYWSIKNTSKNWMKLALGVNWFLLSFIILNEHFIWFPLEGYAIYFPSLSLILLHIYNAKYCRCNKNECCL